tara:strand:+ start:1594 stop:2010 length:417 start_codon:yes stop_codon:yes gene_type:complete
MKSLFIIPLVLMSLVSSPSWALSIDDLVIRAGLYYEKFTATPFTGELDEGQHRGSIKNGKKEGSWVIYHDNGQLQSKGNYKNGDRVGFREEYWPNGQLHAKGNHENGRQEGYWEWYNEDGTVIKWLAGTYKNGMKVSQ